MSQKTKSPVSFWIPLLLSWVFVGVLWWVAPLIVNTQIPVSTGGDSTGMTAGTFGDQFGFINALFSGLALATIAISLWYQRHDIQIQQQALIDQKGVFEKQLRLSAITEVVASLPNFEFQVKTRTETSRRFTFLNKGAQVYDLEISSPSTNWKVKPIQVYRGESDIDGFISGDKVDAIAAPFDFPFTLSFTLRNGEPVTLEYIHENESKVISPNFSLKDKIDEVFQKTMTPHSAA